MATAAEETKEFSFQAEIKQLLHLLAHSLYQSREIAVRELVSNASDALDKMRYVSLTDESARDNAPLEITLEGRPETKEVVVRDNGIGMTHDELVTNLGTIARSGSLEFLKTLSTSGDQKPDLSLIGQFGVGFYSSFMLADKVRVRTRSYKEASGWEWESDGSGTFRVSPHDGVPRGTEVVLHLKPDAHEFAQDFRLKGIIRRYSGFVPHPVRIGGEVVNDQKPIWVEPKNQVTDEQHIQFYQYLSHRGDEKPLWHLHMAADVPIQFRAVLYCPRTNFELMGFGRTEHGLHLCAKRVLVQADCQELLPDNLRFLYGLVDSEDLPLNVSRETLQDNSLIRRIRNTLVKGVLDRLQSLADEKPEEYQAFYKEFGSILREGIASDLPNRERIAKLLRFCSTQHTDKPVVSLDDYVKRSHPDQRRIYFLGGPDIASLQKNPNLEIFRRRAIEVLLLPDPIDEFVMSSLGSFDGRSLTSIDSSDLGLPGGDSEPEAKPSEGSRKGMGRVLELFRAALDERVTEVRESKRLVDSPCCLVSAENSPSVGMQRILRMAHKEAPALRKAMEINPSSPFIDRLARLAANPDNDNFIKQCALQMWSNALLLEGMLLEPEEMVARVQTMMEQAAQAKSSIIV
jgi:molecular chaperone HtpG